MISGSFFWRTRGKAGPGPNRQRGVTIPGLIFLLLVFAFVLTAGFKIGPLYIDNQFIRESIESLENENYREMSDQEIVRYVQRTFDVNNIRDITTRDMKISREKHRLFVSLDYEKRVNFMGNVDVVVRFENHFDSSQL